MGLHRAQKAERGGLHCLPAGAGPLSASILSWRDGAASHKLDLMMYVCVRGDCAAGMGNHEELGISCSHFLAHAHLQGQSRILLPFSRGPNQGTGLRLQNKAQQAQNKQRNAPPAARNSTSGTQHTDYSRRAAQHHASVACQIHADKCRGTKKLLLKNSVS